MCLFSSWTSTRRGRRWFHHRSYKYHHRCTTFECDQVFRCPLPTVPPYFFYILHLNQKRPPKGSTTFCRCPLPPHQNVLTSPHQNCRFGGVKHTRVDKEVPSAIVSMGKRPLFNLRHSARTAHGGRARKRTWQSGFHACPLTRSLRRHCRGNTESTSWGPTPNAYYAPNGTNWTLSGTACLEECTEH